MSSMLRKVKDRARSVLRHFSGKFDPRHYWESRHKRFRDSLGSVGHLRLGDEANRADYACKAEHLLEVLGRHVTDPSGAQLLDAGCGIGFFSEIFAKAGFEVTGVDFSPTAIEKAASSVRGDFRVGELQSLQLGRTFDVVTCLDVLFHVVDDAVWYEVLARLVEHVAPAGVLLVQEALTAVKASEHVHWRRESDYVERMAELGWELVERHTYELPVEKVSKDILVWRRKG